MQMGLILTEQQVSAADDMAAWGAEAIPGLQVTELHGQSERVARLMVRAAEAEQRELKLADMLHEQQRLCSAQEAQIKQMRLQIDMLTGKVEPDMPRGWDGFVFDIDVDEATVPCLAQVEPSDDYEPRASRRYTPANPTVCCVWVNGNWVDVTSLADSLTGCDLDDKAEEAFKRRWEDSWEGA